MEGIEFTAAQDIKKKTTTRQDQVSLPPHRRL
jgi:hypothetical protein